MPAWSYSHLSHLNNNHHHQARSSLCPCAVCVDEKKIKFKKNRIDSLKCAFIFNRVILCCWNITLIYTQAEAIYSGCKTKKKQQQQHSQASFFCVNWLYSARFRLFKHCNFLVLLSFFLNAHLSRPFYCSFFLNPQHCVPFITLLDSLSIFFHQR